MWNTTNNHIRNTNQIHPTLKKYKNENFFKNDHLICIMFDYKQILIVAILTIFLIGSVNSITAKELTSKHPTEYNAFKKYFDDHNLSSTYKYTDDGVMYLIGVVGTDEIVWVYSNAKDKDTYIPRLNVDKTLVRCVWFQLYDKKGNATANILVNGNRILELTNVLGKDYSAPSLKHNFGDKERAALAKREIKVNHDLAPLLSQLKEKKIN